MTLTPTTHTEDIRKAELELVAPDFKPDDRVLEIGGGSGYQAALISEYAGHCDSIDIQPHPESIFPVGIYDGATIPFEDASFDVIFSSNVLEHVIDLDGLLRECARVLKPEGTMIHIVPSVSWRIWTTIGYYPALPKILWSNLQNLRKMKTSPLVSHSAPEHGTCVTLQKAGSTAFALTFGLLRRHFKLKWIRAVLISPRHGERGNELTEALYFRLSWWRSLFDRNDWEIIGETPCRLFYSGNILFGRNLGVKSRTALSRFLGSSTYVFKLAPKRSSLRAN